MHKSNISNLSSGLPRSKKAQTMEIPFQLIFSLILIAIFIYASFTGIKYFLERSDQAKIAQFVADLEAKANNAWQATEVAQTYTFDLPKRVDIVCFGDFTKKISNEVCPDYDVYREQAAQNGANMFFCPPRKIFSIGAPIYYKISCSGNSCLSFKQDLYCISNDGKIDIRLDKRLGSSKLILS